MVFLRRQAPIHLTPERAEELRMSLNSPVVSSPDLPAGPCRAAILVHRELEGTLHLSVGVRSLKTGDHAVWTSDSDLGDAASVDVEIDAALSFSEGMGFLFDDTRVTAAAAHRAWTELIGEATAEPFPAELEIELVETIDPIEPIAPGEADIDWGTPADGDELELADGPGFDLDHASFDTAEPRVSLSKFRGPAPGPAAPSPRRKAARAPQPPAAKAGAEAEADSSRSRAALGKLKLVKRRGDLAAKHKKWLDRVLGSF